MGQTSWKADSLQAALFTPPGMPQPDALQVWQVVRPGASPDGFQRGTNTPMGSSHAQGIVSSASLVIQSQVGRIDFTIQANNTDQNAFPPPQLDDIPRYTSILAECMLLTLAKVKAVRVAFICNAALFFDNTDDLAVRMNEVVAGPGFPLGTSDHIFQFNRRQNFDANRLFHFNRIVTYSTGVAQRIVGQFAPMGTVTTVAEEKKVLVFKVDVNSDPQVDVSSFASSAIQEQQSAFLFVVQNGHEVLT